MERYNDDRLEPFYTHTSVSDNKLLNSCLRSLFRFFKTNDCDSLVDHLNNYNSLEIAILKSEILTCYFNPQTNHYIITLDDFDLTLPQNKVLIFSWSSNSQINNCLIIDLYNKDHLCCLEFYCSSNKYLPFISELEHDIDTINIMLMPDFNDLLSGKLTVIDIGF